MATALQVRPLMADTTEPRNTNNLAWRVSVLERQVQSLLDGKPDLVADRVMRLEASFNEMRTEIKAENRSTRRLVISFATGLAIAIIAAIVALIVTGGNP